MTHLKMRILLNKGNEGIPLEKLERISEQIRRFLHELGEDIALTDPTAWIGVDFKNGSLGWTNQYRWEVDSAKRVRFNTAIGALARGEYVPSLRSSTASQFFRFAKSLDQEEIADMEVFEDDGSPTKFQVSRNTARIAGSPELRPFRESIGALQGTIHSFLFASREPHFNLRELSTGELVRCLYEKDDYAAVIAVLREPSQIVHVRGRIITDTRQRNIDHVRVTQILLAEKFDYEDVLKFLHSGIPQ